MKDLITTIGSIMILMVFVMQFCANQVIATRIFMADVILDELSTGKVEGDLIESCRGKLADCFDCENNEVKFEQKEDKYVIQVPIRNVVACSDFLGISEEKNESIYRREVFRNEEPDNNHSDSNVDGTSK